VQGISPDTVLADRYSLTTRLAGRDDLEHWAARDRTLEREVAVTVFPSSGEHSAAALDGARRAAGIEDSRLVRILDVGDQAGVSYIVEESLRDATSLAELVRERALPTEEVRRIVGETASALEVARQRGLHHLRLTPHAVLVTKEGRVRVSGIAVAGALEGVDDVPSDEASRDDATALVGLIYAGLTGTWPLEPEVPGVPSARRHAGGIPEPAEAALRPGSVPGDLNTLCRLTLGDDAGPLTPGDLASQIAPWSPEPVHGTSQAVGWSGGVTGASAAGAGGAAAAAGAPGSGTGRPGRSDDAQPIDDTQRIDTSRSAAGGDDDGRDDDGRDEDADSDEGDFYGDGDDELESPMPLLPGTVAAEPSGDQAKIALALVAAFVVVAVLLAYCGVAGLTNKDKDAPAAGNTTSQSTPSASPNPTGSDTQSPTSKPTRKAPPAKTLKITSASLMSGPSDDKEPPDVGPAHDGDPDTSWMSHGWNQADFGGLKGGVGLVFDLGKSHEVTEAVLDLPLPEGLTVYVGDDPTTDGATRLGTSSGKDGTVKIKASGDSPPKGRYVIVYITKLVKDTAYHHGGLSEITVKGR
jgi:hypothetical protein